MITAHYQNLRKAERNYPGILKTLRTIETKNTPTKARGITGRTITLATLTDLFQLIPSNPT